MDTLSLTIYNVGTDILTISEVQFDGDNVFSLINSPSFDISPLDENSLDIIFSPIDWGMHSTIITILSNDQNSPEISAILTGNCLIPPQIVVTPDSIFSSSFPLSILT